MSVKISLLLSATILLKLVTSIIAYNIDVSCTKVFNDPGEATNLRESYFGYSLAFYGSNWGDYYLLVGAPRSNSSKTPSIVEPGSVYKCSLKGECTEWALDESPNGVHRRYQIRQTRDNAWLGATISVVNETDPKIVVCAPRWMSNVIYGDRTNIFMNGACYWSHASGPWSLTNEAQNAIFPLSNPSLQVTSVGGIGVYHYGMGQAGFSMSTNAVGAGVELVLGCPGVHNWKGTPILNYLDSDRVSTVVPQVKNERNIRSGDYFGYSVTSGNYFKKDNRLYASGAPRSANMRGSVIIFTFPTIANRPINPLKIVEGKQNGEYFGSSMTSCDLNGDDREELLVGAPMWSSIANEGRVYIYTSRNGESFEVEVLEGEAINGRFGTTISCLGDVNHDGLNDFAIGAPYENEHGAIYIYNGNWNGIPNKYSQRISGSEFSSAFRGFGISISEARDVNGDGYPDLAVGAYASGHAVVLKSRQVVTIDVKLNYVEQKKLLRNSTFFSINVCTSYRGVHAPDNLNIIRHLKVDDVLGRASYLNKSGSHQLPAVLYNNVKLCDRLQIQLDENIQNIIDPIEIAVTVTIKNDSRKHEKFVKDLKLCMANPVLNTAMSKIEDTIQLPFAVDCGDDNVCSSDIGVQLTTNLIPHDRFVVASSPTLTLNLFVYNDGEPAYQTKANIFIPKPLALASIPRECMEDSFVNNTLLVVCNVKNPLRTNRTMTLELDTTSIRFDTNPVNVSVIVTTQSEETNFTNNAYNLTINLDMDVDIAIAGKAQEDLISYIDRENNKVSEIKFHHVYEVQKFGASPVEAVRLTILIPTFWKNQRIATINQTIGYMDGLQFYCNIFNYTPEAVVIQPGNEVGLKSYYKLERLVTSENPTLNVPPENRTVYLNCSNPSIQCEKIECDLGAFLSSLTVAKLTLNLDFHLSKLQLKNDDERDIIFFVSDGHVNITQPRNIIQPLGHKPDSVAVATTFVGTPIEQQVAIWIIALSVLLGILLLIILILVLIKVGFFKRKKKEELELLKAETDVKHGFTLETSASTEALEQD